MAYATRAVARKAAAQQHHHDESDYGSDLDDATIEELLSPGKPLASPVVLESIEEGPPTPPTTRSLRVKHVPPLLNKPPRILVDEDGVPFEVLARDGPIREPSVEVEYDESNRVAFSPRRSATPLPERAASVGLDEGNNDGRSPLERFRTKPKKPLSVTDLVSPAWCELQYWYSLTKYGRVKKTPAMRQGSSVHKVLEEQVHTAVPVEVVTREDMFGLRLWNMIQGLRTLRATGMTRELEVFGVIEGQVVNGVIDELSYTCPDEELKHALDKRGTKGKKDKPLPPDQKTMQDFFAKPTTTIEEPTRVDTPTKTVYIMDVKTRGSRKVPDSEVSLRPTYIQLMLYHKLLELLASNAVPADAIFSRNNIEGETTFSDTFIAEIGGLDYNFRQAEAEGAAPFSSTQDSVEELLAHNTPSKLWQLMMTEFGQTISSTSIDSSIGIIMKAEFRTPGSGDIIGSKSFVYDGKKLETYVREEMAWWKGERQVKGVDIEEAFKCRICEFAPNCDWRQNKVEEGLRRAQLKKDGRRRSEV